MSEEQSSGKWGKRGPAIAGRDVEFEVQAFYNKHWVTESSFAHEKEAIAFAKSLFTDDDIEEVKVIRFRAMVGGGLSLKKEVFTERRPPKQKKTITLSGKITEGRVCTTVAEFTGLESRIVMNRILRQFFDHMMITPTELIHNYGYQKKLDSMGLVSNAVAQLAQAQSNAGHGDMRSRIDAIYTLVQQVMSKAQETMAERKRIPLLIEGQYGTLCRRIDSVFPEDQRDYMIKTALTNYLNGSGSLGGKLDQIGALVTEDVDDEKANHLDDLIADLLGVGQTMQDMLGDQPSLGAALGVLADMVRGQFDIAAQRKPTAQMKMVHNLLNHRGMAASKAVLLDRLRREFLTNKPLIRANDPAIERQVFQTLMAKLTTPDGKHIFGADFEDAARKRNEAIRRQQLQKLGIAT